MVPTVANWNQTNDEFSLILDQNPLTDFVELPEDHPNLLYSNILCGVIRGALEMVSTATKMFLLPHFQLGDFPTHILSVPPPVPLDSTLYYVTPQWYC